ncbi:MAG: hypothetical protein DRO65_03365, partial [Candidatus Altiarchaeales archaeon]
FYEKSSKHSIDRDYTRLKAELEKRGYRVEKIDIPITREVLESRNPDVLVIAGLKEPLTAQELAAVLEFVMYKGKGLFVVGGWEAKSKGLSPANQIVIPFGVMLDSAPLEDEKNPVVESSKILTNRKYFVIKRFNRKDPTIKSVVYGVRELAFFEGPGIILPEGYDNTLIKVVANGSYDAYSPQSIHFQKGSMPPIAVAALVGRGLVFVLSDDDMLSDKYTDPAKYNYDNIRFAANIIDWLRTKSVTGQLPSEISELQLIIGQMKVEMENMNTTLKEKDKKIAELQSQVTNLNGLLSICEEENNRLKSQTDPVLGISYTNWGIILIGLCILIFMIVKFGKSKAKEKETEETEEELGYEFEEEEGIEEEK